MLDVFTWTASTSSYSRICISPLAITVVSRVPQFATASFADEGAAASLRHHSATHHDPTGNTVALFDRLVVPTGATRSLLKAVAAEEAAV